MLNMAIRIQRMHLHVVLVSINKKVKQVNGKCCDNNYSPVGKSLLYPLTISTMTTSTHIIVTTIK